MNKDNEENKISEQNTQVTQKDSYINILRDTLGQTELIIAVPDNKMYHSVERPCIQTLLAI